MGKISELESLEHRALVVRVQKDLQECLEELMFEPLDAMRPVLMTKLAELAEDYRCRAAGTCMLVAITRYQFGGIHLLVQMLLGGHEVEFTVKLTASAAEFDPPAQAAPPQENG